MKFIDDLLHVKPYDAGEGPVLVHLTVLFTGGVTDELTMWSVS